MKDKLIWHYLTKRSDDIQVGDYYCFSETGDIDIVFKKEDVKYHYLVKLSVSEIVLMRLKGKTKDFVWQAVKKSQRKKYDHHRIQGKCIRSLSDINL